MNTHKIGNVFEKSFKEIWFSERHMKAFLNTDPEKCKHFDCPLQPPVPMVLEAIVKGKMHLEFI